MSTMQTFRDGLRADLRRRMWRQIGKLIGVLMQAGCIVFALYYAWRGQYDRATFFAVLYLWGER